jgi:hypothetical protein
MPAAANNGNFGDPVRSQLIEVSTRNNFASDVNNLRPDAARENAQFEGSANFSASPSRIAQGDFGRCRYSLSE